MTLKKPLAIVLLFAAGGQSDHFTFIHPTNVWQQLTIANFAEGDFEVDDDNFLVEIVEE
jgi:hypothetical protein